MSKEKLTETINNIENIKANVSFLFFADKAIHRLAIDNYHISDIDLVGMDNVKDLVLEQLSSLSKEVIEIEKAIK
jgi:ADP-dependent phosphofructokinase/glucokinase